MTIYNYYKKNFEKNLRHNKSKQFKGKKATVNSRGKKRKKITS